MSEKMTTQRKRENILQKKLDQLEDNNANISVPSICRVPHFIRQSRNSCYDPQLVSIGPYHRLCERLQPMEHHKLRYLKDLVHRSPKIVVKDLLIEMKSHMRQMQSYYSETIELSSDELAEMMLLDGGFIIELLQKRRSPQSSRKGDPIYENPHYLVYVAYDLLLAENQLPFFVLRILFSRLKSPESPSLEYLATDFFNYALSMKMANTNENQREGFHHLLHLVHYHHCLQANSYICGPMGNFEECIRSIPSATRLYESGVRFQMKKPPPQNSLIDITFTDGVMEIPYVFLGDGTESLLRNLIAFEQCCWVPRRAFTNYAVVMDYLMNTSRDVEILSQNGIIENGLGSHEEAAQIFNRLGQGVMVNFENPELQDLFNRITKYSNTKLHKWRASLMHDYFSSPWAFISVMAALLLLGLTLVQTIFTAVNK